MNEELLQEIPLSAPAEVRPKIAVAPPVVSVPAVPTSQFTVPAPVGVPQSSGQSVDASIQAKWAKLSALRKPYPVSPPPANWGSQGFNVSTNVQDSQAKIPQFFNFIGSRTDDVQAANKTSVNVSASSSQIPNSVPRKYPEVQCEPAYYICPFDGTNKMTNDNQLAIRIREERIAEGSGRRKQHRLSFKDRLSFEEARIRKEVRSVVNQQFAEARAKLGSNLVAHMNISKSGNATANVDIIDLISQSIASLQKLQPSVLVGSPISVASTPYPMLGMVGALRDFCIFRLVHTPRLPRHHSPQCSGSPRNHRVSMGEAQRMSIHGPPLCVTISLSWVVVMHNRPRTP